jgi:hypothetical protein
MTNLIDLITPTNLDLEREKFFASSHYNPTFHYTWQDREPNAEFEYFTKQNLWEAIKNQDHNDIMRSASRLFEVQIDADTLLEAKQVATTKGKTSSGSASEYIELMNRAFEYFDIKDIKVLMSEESGFNVRPKHEDKVILVSKHIHFEYFSMEGGVRHELVHVIRDKNSHFNHIKRVPNYLPTEEGLASWCQDNTNDDNGAAQHAIEYVGSSVGLSGSLRDIFDCMCELGMSPDLAWKRSSRHKFGFVDTALPGDILKPAMYYANEINVAKMSTAEKLRLFVGKISMTDLSTYPIYTGIWQPEKLIKYFNLI